MNATSSNTLNKLLSKIYGNHTKTDYHKLDLKKAQKLLAKEFDQLVEDSITEEQVMELSRELQFAHLGQCFLQNVANVAYIEFQAFDEVDAYVFEYGDGSLVEQRIRNTLALLSTFGKPKVYADFDGGSLFFDIGKHTFSFNQQGMLHKDGEDYLITSI